MNIGKALKIELIRKNKTAKDVAALLNVSHQNIFVMLANPELSNKALCRICGVIDSSPAAVMKEAEGLE